MYNTQQNLDYRHIIKSENYNEEQLKELTEPTSEYAFGQISKLVNMHPRIKELEETKTKLISENRVQAEQNLSRKDEYVNIKQRVREINLIFIFYRSFAIIRPPRPPFSKYPCTSLKKSINCFGPFISPCNSTFFP